MSAGFSPASAMAALTHSAASRSSERPEFLEISVIPMPTMAVSSLMEVNMLYSPVGGAEHRKKSVPVQLWGAIQQTAA